MGKGGKGGGGGSVPKAKIPYGQFQSVINAAQNLGTYESSMLSDPLGLGNWGMNIATGGEVSPFYFGQPGSQYGYAPYQSQFAQSPWATPPWLVNQEQQLLPQQLAAYASQASGVPTGSQYGYAPAGTQPTAASTASGTTPSWSAQGGTQGLGSSSLPANAQPGITTAQAPGAGGFIQYYTANGPAQWNPQTGDVQVQGRTIGNTNTSNAWGGANAQTWAWAMPSASQLQSMRGESAQQQGGQGAGISAGGGAGTQGGGAQQGGFNLPGAELAALQMMGQQAGQTPTGLDPATLAGLQSVFFGRADPSQIPGGVLPSSGLYPQQQALIDQQTKATQAATTQQPANLGWGPSTQGTLLSGEIGQAGAAAAGQLIQGNLQIAQAAQGIAQNWAKLGMGEQTLSMSEQEQQFSQTQQLAAQLATAQSQFFSEGMQGYGLFGQMLNQVLSSYGLETSALSDVTNASLQQAEIAAQIETASMSQQSSASSSAFGALGSLFTPLGIGGAAGGGGSIAGAAIGAIGGILGAI